LESGKVFCDDSDQVTYEACLIFQSSVAFWYRLGSPQNCPPAPIGKEIRPLTQLKKLKREDIFLALNSVCFNYIYAVFTANTVPVLINAANRSFQILGSAAFREPGSNPELCLIARGGICGNQTAVAIALLERVGLPARSVQFFYSLNGVRHSHIVPEVFIDGKWRLIDSTYGAFWTSTTNKISFELLSTDELLGIDRVIRSDQIARFANVALLNSGDPESYFIYLHSQGSILRGGVGVINIDIEGESGRETFGDLPNYLGDNQADRSSKDVKINLSMTSNRNYKLKVIVKASAFIGEKAVNICLDDVCLPFSKQQSVYEFILQKPSTLSLKSDLDVAYAVLEALEWNN
jgi:hypothetical protein